MANPEGLKKVALTEVFEGGEMLINTSEVTPNRYGLASFLLDESLKALMNFEVATVILTLVFKDRVEKLRLKKAD